MTKEVLEEELFRALIELKKIKAVVELARSYITTYGEIVISTKADRCFMELEEDIKDLLNKVRLVEGE